jgi:hypothetical protein
MSSAVPAVALSLPNCKQEYRERIDILRTRFNANMAVTLKVSQTFDQMAKAYVKKMEQQVEKPADAALKTSIMQAIKKEYAQLRANVNYSHMLSAESKEMLSKEQIFSSEGMIPEYQNKGPSPEERKKDEELLEAMGQRLHRCCSFHKQLDFLRYQYNDYLAYIDRGRGMLVWEKQGNVDCYGLDQEQLPAPNNTVGALPSFPSPDEKYRKRFEIISQYFTAKIKQIREERTTNVDHWRKITKRLETTLSKELEFNREAPIPTYPGLSSTTALRLEEQKELQKMLSEATAEVQSFNAVPSSTLNICGVSFEVLLPYANGYANEPSIKPPL